MALVWLLAAAVGMAWTEGAIRSHHNRIRSAIDEASHRSRTFRQLVEQLTSSDLIVYVEAGRCPGAPVLSCTTLTSAGGSSRYLRITIDTAHSRQLISRQIAHELQHAVEIGQCREVVDPESLRQLYRRIGHQSATADVYETATAIHVADAVARELSLAEVERWP